MHGTTRTVHAAARLDRLPLSAFHWKLLLLIGAGLFLDAFDLYLGGSLTATMLKSGWSTLELNAWFGTATFAGLMVGSWFAGVLGDRYGRRFSFQLNLSLFGAASLAAAFAPDMHWLIGLRFIMGIGLGAEIVVAYSMLSEFVPPSDRGRMLAFLGLFANSAVFIATFVSLWVTPAFGWRPLFAAVGIIAIGVWLARKTLPESPRWLESKGRFDEAEATLAAIEAEVGRTKAVPDYDRTDVTPVRQASFSTLFTGDVLPRTILGCLIMATIGFGIYGFLTWLPSFFVKEGRDIVTSLTWTAVVSLGGPIGNIIAFLIADRIGRKPALIGATIVGSLAGVFYLSATSDVLLLAAAFLMATAIYFLVGIGQGIYVPELFSTSYRLRGAGVCGTAGRAASMGCQFLILWLFTRGGAGLVVGAVIASLLFLGLMVLLIGTETRGRRLEEIAPAKAA